MRRVSRLLYGGACIFFSSRFVTIHSVLVATLRESCFAESEVCLSCKGTRWLERGSISSGIDALGMRAILVVTILSMSRLFSTHGCGFALDVLTRLVNVVLFRRRGRQ